MYSSKAQEIKGVGFGSRFEQQANAGSSWESHTSDASLGENPLDS
jgi:hypothetical protein